MGIVDKFAEYIIKLTKKSPEKARKLLITGWQAQDLKFRFLSDKRLPRSDRYLAHMMMSNMLRPLKGERSAIVSAFTPCEMIQELGLTPYNVESFSSYMCGTKIEEECISAAENEGISDTLCSYHKVFIGAVILGIMPRPECIVYTNVACDANLLTFKYLEEKFDVPSFCIDVPYTTEEDDIDHVRNEIIRMKDFLEEITGKKISLEGLKKRIGCSARTQKKRIEFQRSRSGRFIKTDLTSHLYAALSANVYSGTEEEERFVSLQLDDVDKAPEKNDKISVYWMHTIPFWSDDVKRSFYFSDKAQICGCEIGDLYIGETYGDDPYRYMAEKLVRNSLNGSHIRRIENGIECAKRNGADGVIWFNHWGCKHTYGCSHLAKEKFEKAGIPFLSIDGDGVDRKNGSEGQLRTRIEAFIEMLSSSTD